jgi:DNA helicase-2/ATP-dependent DNA helicase PcrA
MILDESGYTRMWQVDKSPEAEGRLENLTELVNAMQEFDSLQGFLEHIALVMDGDTEAENGEVTLMTLHAAKGLEFDTIFLPGWEEGIFPSQRTIDENGALGLEEERRLAYVGITRARCLVNISYAGSRRIHGQWQSSIPSRFLQEIPPDHVIEDVVQGMGGGYGNFGRATPATLGDGVGFGGAGYGPGWRRMAERQKRASDPSFVARDSGDAFARGDRVFHQKFGMGNILNVDGDKLEIAFDRAGHKKVVAGFVSKP